MPHPYLDAVDGNARLRIGLLSNPLAKTNWRSVAHPRLRALLPEPELAVETPRIDALDATFETLLLERGVNVVILNGGDGTIHHALNSALRVLDRASVALGRPLPSPAFLFVNGGGMNMLARVLGTVGHPVGTVRRFLALARGSRLGSIPRRPIPLLAVREPSGRVRHGYIFGSELVFNALTMYERFGQGYLGLSRLLWEVSAGQALRTDLWHRYGHLLEAPETPLVVDGEVFPRYAAAVATTVPLALAKGLLAAVRGLAAPGTMSGIAVLPVIPEEIIRLIPTLMVAASTPGVRRWPSGGSTPVRRMALAGPYTLDGERFDLHEVRGETGLAPALAPIEVFGTDRIVWGVDLA
jgi:hypothetical protein